MTNTLRLLALMLLLPLAAMADTMVWRGPTQSLTIGLTQDDIAHVEMPEPITNVTLENQDYVDVLVVEGYNNRAFRMRSLLPKMATRMFLTGASGNTYILILTTDVPYRAFLQVVNGLEIDNVARKISNKFGPHDLVRGMATNTDMPGVQRETYVVPNWFKGGGLTFDLSEVWQSPKLTGIVVNVRNDTPAANEVNLPAVTLPRTDEWGTLRYAAMENLRMAPAGRPGDRGVLFLVFMR
ncbi:MAG: hypothetical protein H6922_05725 [Pseudomonadaceae bacterium]|nr:hypothetical protein [Pseudomonadaceae bacterium]